MNVPTRQADTSQCLRMACVNSQLILYVGGSPVECPPGGFLEIADISGEGLIRLGPCPEPSDICPTLSCPADCNTNGRCLDGECQCFLGYTGEECSHTVCWIDSCAEGEYCNLDLGKCEVAIQTTKSPAERGLPMPGFDNFPIQPKMQQSVMGRNNTNDDDETEGEEKQTEVDDPKIQLGGSLVIIDVNAGTMQNQTWVRNQSELIPICIAVDAAKGA